MLKNTAGFLLVAYLPTAGSSSGATHEQHVLVGAESRDLDELANYNGGKKLYFRNNYARIDVSGTPNLSDAISGFQTKIQEIKVKEGWYAKYTKYTDIHFSQIKQENSSVYNSKTKSTSLTGKPQWKTNIRIPIWDDVTDTNSSGKQHRHAKIGYSIPKGGKENSETPIDTAVRELIEEVGFVPNFSKIQPLVNFNGNNYVCIYQVDQNEYKQIQDTIACLNAANYGELFDIRWVPIRSITSNTITSSAGTINQFNSFTQGAIGTISSLTPTPLTNYTGNISNAATIHSTLLSQNGSLRPEDQQSLLTILEILQQQSSSGSSSGSSTGSSSTGSSSTPGGGRKTRKHKKTKRKTRKNK